MEEYATGKHLEWDHAAKRLAYERLRRAKT